jgi:tetratricopeptide (TPR) repeat protein
LADGYYSSLIDKHPDHPLSHFGKLRRLDISAIKALDGEQADQFNKIAAKLDQIRTKDLPELAAQIAIRQAYWRQPAAAINQHGPRQRWLPTLTPERRVELSAVSQHVENPKTAFLIDSLTLNSYLDQPDSWDNRATRFAGEYFKRFQGGAAEPFRDTLQQKTRNLLKTRLQKLVDNGQLLKAIELFESLPQGLERIGEAPATAWAMAQAYRKLQQPEQAAKLYKQAGDQMGVSPKKFRALFWRLESLVKQLAIAKSENSPTARIRQLEDHIRSTDEQGLQVWEKLKNSERGMLFTALQPELEAGLNETALTKTHPNLVHWAWSGRLTTAAAGGTTSNQQIGDGLNPSRQTVYLLSDLAKRFGQLGQAGKQQEAKNLLRFMSPADFNGDDQAAKLWAQELVNLAETYRRNNQYLKAGRLYTLTGEKSQNWEKRAEALYKGGLLLYRSGRREEAIKAFNEAANDGNNLLYAELAQKRLEQLNE